MRVSTRRASIVNTYCGLLHIRKILLKIEKHKSKSQPNFFDTNHISHKDSSNQHFCLHFQPRENLIDRDMNRSKRSSGNKHYNSFILSLLLVFLDNLVSPDSKKQTHMWYWIKMGLMTLLLWIRASKKIPSCSPGLVDFLAGRVTFIAHLPNGARDQTSHLPSESLTKTSNNWPQVSPI